MSPDAKHHLPSYVAWTATVWAQQNAQLEMRDWAIMSLGLGGEVGEVLEVIEQARQAGALDQEEALKEMGDVFYYWCRIVHAFGLNALELLEVENSSLPAIAQALHNGPALPRLEAASALSTGAGRVQEWFKKLIRDEEGDPARLALAMREVGHAWFALARSLGLDPAQAVAHNVAKISGRLSRGTLRGSGNDR